MVTPDGRFDEWATRYERGTLQPRLCRSVHQALLARLGQCRLAAGRVLDIGCGTGVLAESIRRRYPMATVLGIDPAPAMVAQAAARRPALRLACGRFEALPFAGGVFDVVTCTLVWRHVADPRSAVAECRRVLAPGGLLVLADAFDSRTVRPAPWRPAVAGAAVRLCRALTAAGLPVLLAETVSGFGPVAEATVVIAGLPYADRRPVPDAPLALPVRPVPAPRAPVAAYRGAATAVAATVPVVWPGTGRW